MPYRVALVNLGCPKNEVDGQVMLGLLEQAGFEVTGDPDAADVLLVNTCGFIAAAEEESVDAILAAARRKEAGDRVLVVAGCLAQRHGEELLAALPEVDAVVGTGYVPAIADLVRRALSGERVLAVGEPGYRYDRVLPRRTTGPRHVAYVKIAEGCDNRCTYCTIPFLRGRYRSRPLEVVVEEARGLAARGARELVLVAQDTTRYGLDLYGRPRLADLLRALARLEDVRWVRVLYGHPGHLTPDVLAVMAEEPRVCRYLDLPLQHVHPDILRRMGRRGSPEELLRLVEDIRAAVPGVVLRTTFMVGFPGETEAEFGVLRDFVAAARFERAGVFAFSPEEGTPAARLPDQVPEEVREERRRELLLMQRRLSLARNRSLVGRVWDVMVDGRTRGGLYLGRTEGDAPEVDGRVFFRAGTSLAPGHVVRVRITRGYSYDLAGVAEP
ncbi:MAG: 30S ribosomal protein S12 methylthiotransferase RimO [Desulfotomaculales bacterium]